VVNPFRQLTRRSTGLTEAHVALIHLLAERAVDEYLSEEHEAEKAEARDKAARDASQE
jgi:hypothetical protein